MLCVLKYVSFGTEFWLECPEKTLVWSDITGTVCIRPRSLRHRPGRSEDRFFGACILRSFPLLFMADYISSNFNKYM